MDTRPSGEPRSRSDYPFRCSAPARSALQNAKGGRRFAPPFFLRGWLFARFAGLSPHGSITTVQVYVPGTRPAVVCGVVDAEVSPVHCTVDAVTPAPASEVVLTVI